MIDPKDLSLGDEVEVFYNNRYIIDSYQKDFDCNKYKKTIAKVYGISPFINDYNQSVIIEVAENFEYWELPKKELYIYERDFNFKFISDFPDKIRAWQIPYSSISSILTKKSLNSGCFCLECKEYYPYAVPNRENGLLCYSCRTSVGWKYS